MDELKKYKHLLLPLVVIVVAFMGIKSYKKSVDLEMSNLLEEYRRLDEIIQADDSVAKAKENLSKVNSALVDYSHDELLSNIISLASDSQLVVLSSRKGQGGVARRGARSVRRMPNSDENSVVDYRVMLELLGDSEKLAKFLNEVDSIEKYVVIETMKVNELLYGSRERERYDGAVLKASIVVKAKAINKAAVR